MSLQACRYWQGYNGQKPPRCGPAGGSPCVQCMSKFIKVRGWTPIAGMWESPHDRTAHTLLEAHQIETKRFK